MNSLKIIDAGTVSYEVADAWQGDLRRRRTEGEIVDVLLLLEHPHVYTLGRRFARDHLLVDPQLLAEKGIDVYEADRGGSITYHGPGQLVGYPILDLTPEGEDGAKPQPDVILYLRRLEEVLIRTARTFGVIAGRRPKMTGVWVGQSKLASIGVNVSRGVSKHGFAINVSTDLSFFDAMIPCGIPEAQPTSLETLLNRKVPIEAVRAAVIHNFSRIFHSVPIPGSLGDLGLSEEGSSGLSGAGQVVELRPARGTVAGAAGD